MRSTDTEANLEITVHLQPNGKYTWSVTACDSAENAVARIREAYDHLETEFGAKALPTPVRVLNNKGKRVLKWLMEHSDRTNEEEFYSSVKPCNSTLTWLEEHGFISFDTSAQRWVVLRPL